jgi:hexosaminidase
MRTFLCLLFFPLWLSAIGISQVPPADQLKLMPLPSDFQVGNGRLAVNGSFSVALTGYREDRLSRAVERFLNTASRQTGLPIKKQSAHGDKAVLTIHTEHASKPLQEPGEDESYTLEITSAGAKLSAANPLGVMHGLQTFLQLIEATPEGFAVPAVTIRDRPRFVWRGLMIDVGRHFIPLDVLRRNLDGMEAVKLNVFHWHLSDNQGFRVESKKYPKLQEMGSDGLFYTQAEVRDLIEYARDRGIRVVPEFDMPGHSTSWFVGYPDLASAPGPYQIERKWGVFDPAMDPTRDNVYKFLDDFIGEMARLFADPYFHIGGDEVNGKQWDANPKIQEFKKAHNLQSNEALQTYFTQHVQKIVSKHHKMMVGWDEILSPGMPKDIVIQSWRGQESLGAATKQGYRGILSNGYYIDLNWAAARHYAVDPLADGAANLSPEEKGRILGGEATMWSEYVGPEIIDSRIWPRTAVIAERLWSAQNVTDVESMYSRMNQLSWRLDFLGLTHNVNRVPMLQRIAGKPGIDSLRVLADVVEPVKDYTREELAATAPTQEDPLNRLVDAVSPESEVAREFSQRVDGLIAGQCQDQAAMAEIRTALLSWRNNDDFLQPASSDSSLLREAAATSKNLARIAAVGLQAVDSIEHKETAPDSWVKAESALVQEAQKPNSAQLLLPVAPAVQKLVEASAATGACKGK